MEMAEQIFEPSQNICGDGFDTDEYETVSNVNVFRSSVRRPFEKHIRIFKHYKNICDYTRELYQMFANRSTVICEHLL
jgi:lantibiotic modifying enzyme